MLKSEGRLGLISTEENSDTDLLLRGRLTCDGSKHDHDFEIDDPHCSRGCTKIVSDVACWGYLPIVIGTCSSVSPFTRGFSQRQSSSLRCGVPSGIKELRSKYYHLFQSTRNTNRDQEHVSSPGRARRIDWTKFCHVVKNELSGA